MSMPGLPAAPIPMRDIAALKAELVAAGLETSDERALLRLRSRDFYWYSPILKRQLDGKAAELIVRPRSEAEVLATLAACRQARVPVTARGGATGNYGQCVPLAGGVLLDMTAMDRCHSVIDGVAEVEPGAKLIDVDLWAREQGWEIRLWPSTKRSATIGGFIAGGGAGVGSITHGTMKERGNLHSVRVATMQDPPQVLELAGDAANVVNRAYGTTGILTLIRLPLAPAQAWRDVGLAFADFSAAARFALAFAHSDGIPKKMCAVFDAMLPPFFKGIAAAVPAGHALVLAMVAPSAMVALRDLAAEHGGRILAEQDTQAAERDADATPFYEYCWNHTTLQVLKRDKGVTYLQCRFPFEDTLAAVEAMRSRFPEEVWMHTECVRFGGRITMTALPIIRWTDEARLRQIMAEIESLGIAIANPHTVSVEEGSSYRRVEGDQLGFKRMIDPLGLLNPGKMTSFTLETAA